MSRRARVRLVLPAFAALLLWASAPVAPANPGGVPAWAAKKTTTTQAATTTIVATTTTVEPTTTTTGPTTTTSAPTTTTPPACGPPVTITAGGIYSGCYRSTDPATPAVRVTTNQLITLDHARVEHAGVGVSVSVTGAQLDTVDSTFQALTVPAGTDQRDIYAWGAVRLVVEHNSLHGGGGVKWLAPTVTPTVGRVRFNDIRDVGSSRPTYNETAFQADSVTLGGLEVAWNRITNTPLASDMEDNINFYRSHGTPAAPIDVHHNLVDGAYPTTLGPGNFTGGGINLGDGCHTGDPSTYVTARDNTVVSTSNYGLTIPAGHDNHIMGNTVVNDGLANGIPTGNPNGVGIAVWEDCPGLMTPPTDAHDNTIGFMRALADGSLVRQDTWMPECGNDPGEICANTAMAAPIDAADEQVARDAWEAARAAAGVTVGPRP